MEIERHAIEGLGVVNIRELGRLVHDQREGLSSIGIDTIAHRHGEIVLTTGAGGGGTTQ